MKREATFAPEAVPATRVLLVDDEPGLRRALGRLLSDAGYVVTTASDGQEAIAKVESTSFDVIVSDLGGDLYQGYLFARPGRGFPEPVY